jgi:hypothetical protein
MIEHISGGGNGGMAAAAAAAAAASMGAPVQHPALPAYALPPAGSSAIPLLDLGAGYAAPPQVLLQLAPSSSAPHYLVQPGYLPPAPAPLPTLSGVQAHSGQQQEQGAPSASDAGGDGKRRRGPRPRVFKKFSCQSDNCPVDLAPLSFYLQRNHICPVSWKRGGACLLAGWLPWLPAGCLAGWHDPPPAQI